MRKGVGALLVLFAASCSASGVTPQSQALSNNAAQRNGRAVAPGAVGASVLILQPNGLNNWTSKASDPVSSTGLAVGVVDHVLYALGGFGNAGANTPPFNNVEAYVPKANAWYSKAPMLTGRFAPAVGVIHNVLYAVGGQTSNNIVNVVEAYNPKTNAWTTKAPMPTARDCFGIGVVKGVLYAAGGQNNTTFLNTVEAYNPATDTWTTKAPMPTPRTCLGVAVVKDILYAVGGGNSSNSDLSTVEAYDPLRIHGRRRLPCRQGKACSPLPSFGVRSTPPPDAIQWPATMQPSRCMIRPRTRGLRLRPCQPEVTVQPLAPLMAFYTSWVARY